MFKQCWAWIKLVTDNFSTVLTGNRRDPRDYAPLKESTHTEERATATFCRCSCPCYILHFHVCMHLLSFCRTLNQPLSGLYAYLRLQLAHLNPLSPDIKMHILLTVLYTFLMELVRRIFQISRHLILGDHFLFSPHLNV